MAVYYSRLNIFVGIFLIKKIIWMIFVKEVNELQEEMYTL